MIAAPTPEQRARDKQLAWLIVGICAFVSFAIIVGGLYALRGIFTRWAEQAAEQSRAPTNDWSGSPAPVVIETPDTPDEVHKGSADRNDDDEDTVTVPPPLEPRASLSTAPGTARPLGDVASWITPDDYPAAARRAGNEGRTKVTLTVGESGRPVACSVAVSSGYASLDGATCGAMMARGRFNPPGEPRRWTSPFIRWQLPT